MNPREWHRRALGLIEFGLSQDGCFHGSLVEAQELLDVPCDWQAPYLPAARELGESDVRVLAADRGDRTALEEPLQTAFDAALYKAVALLHEGDLSPELRHHGRFRVVILREHDECDGVVAVAGDV